MKPSLVPLLMIVVLAAVRFAAWRAARDKRLDRPGWIDFLLVLLIAWGAITTWLGYHGFYLSKPFLASYPTLWVPFLPVVIVFTALMLSASARRAVDQLIDATPQTWLVGIHALRILAIGTLVKAWQGSFVVSFALWVGIPDLLFGLSALLMMRVAAGNGLSTRALLLWNMVGVLVILPGAPLVAQMGLPGFLHAFDETPPMTTVYEFPMVLAPTFVVPVFVMMNMLVAMRSVARIAAAKTLAAAGRGA